MKKHSQCPFTTSNGAPVAEDQDSISAGERGSLTFDNFRLFEKLAHSTASAFQSASCMRAAPAPTARSR